MAEIIRLNDKTWRIEDGFVRFLLLAGSEKAALIDSGVESPDARQIAESLTDLPVILINTHSDGDHISGNAAFEEFYMSPAEEERYRSHGAEGKVIPVSEGDIIDLGGRPLEIIDVPGHTPGSIAVLDVNNRVLISGDTVQDDNIFMFGDGRDLDQFIGSLHHLLEFEGRFDEVYPMHGSFPVMPVLIRQLISGSEDIKAGKASGEKINMFGFDVMLYKYPYAGIICDL